MVAITTTAGDEILVDAFGNPNAPVRMTVRGAGTDLGTQVEALLDGESNDVLVSALMAQRSATS
jgi:hypothetical protein